MKYTEKLRKAVEASGSHVVVGLDSDIQKVPDVFHKYSNPVLEFNRQVIQATKNSVAGYKINVAFYEYLEESGTKALKGSLNEIPESLISICDAKRGDLANTTELYARTYFDKYGFDSITANAYMGRDSLEPFFKREGKLTYILALTSNPGSAEFQHLGFGGKKLYQKIIDDSIGWTDEDRTGYVFGANYCKELAEFTGSNPGKSVLIPGIGAQCNELEPLLASLHTDLFLINSSRAVIYSAAKDCSTDEFAVAVKKAVKELNDSINNLKPRSR